MENIVGKTLSYKDITTALDLPYYNSGNQKKAQVKQLESEYEMNKVGTKYEIIAKREVIVPTIDNRVTTLPYIEACLLLFLNGVENKSDCFISGVDIAYICHLINNNYRMILKTGHEYDLEVFDNYLNNNIISINVNERDSLKVYSDTTYSKLLKPSIETALKSMEGRREITKTKAFKLDNNDGNFTCVDVNDDLGKEIWNIQAETMKEMNVVKFKEFFGRKADLLPTFYENVNAKIVEKSHKDETWIKNGWRFKRAFQCWHIVPYTEKINWDIQKLFNNEEKLNKIIYNKLKDSKLLEDLSSKAFKTCFECLNTEKGDDKYPIASDIRELQRKKQREKLEKIMNGY